MEAKVGDKEKAVVGENRLQGGSWRVVVGFLQSWRRRVS
jgi:hypothetical protein